LGSPDVRGGPSGPSGPADLCVRVVAGIHGFQLLLMGFVTPLLPLYFAWVTTNDSLTQDMAQPWLPGLVLGLFFSLFMLPFLALLVAAVVGLLLRRPWGWVAALVWSVMEVSSCWAPVALVCIVMLARRDVRQACGILPPEGE